MRRSRVRSSRRPPILSVGSSGRSAHILPIGAGKLSRASTFRAVVGCVDETAGLHGGSCGGAHGDAVVMWRWWHASTRELEPIGTDDHLSGKERLGWNQAAADAGQLARLRYAAYVDSIRVELADVSCSELSGGVSACSSRMPAMAAGTHTIVVVSFVVDGDRVIEKPDVTDSIDRARCD